MLYSCFKMTYYEAAILARVHRNTIVSAGTRLELNVRIL